MADDMGGEQRAAAGPVERPYALPGVGDRVLCAGQGAAVECGVGQAVRHGLLCEFATARFVSPCILVAAPPAQSSAFPSPDELFFVAIAGVD